MGFTETAFLLVAAHFVVDFPLQGDTVALQKSRHTDNALAKAVPWPYWMTAHAMSHGLAVYLITHDLFLGLFELIAHGFIDVLKCDKIISIHVDQALHLLCKVLYLVVLVVT